MKGSIRMTVTKSLGNGIRSRCHVHVAGLTLSLLTEPEPEWLSVVLRGRKTTHFLESVRTM